MLIVFAAGAAGFFVFDAYRMYSDRMKHGYLVVTFVQLKAISAHVIIYAAAGLLGVMTNIDVLHSDSITFVGRADELGELAGPIFRSFSIGVLGPAGLKKGQATGKERRPPSEGQTVDDTPLGEVSFLDYIRYFLMR